jgi:hypothetical protein
MKELAPRLSQRTSKHCARPIQKRERKRCEENKMLKISASSRVDVKENERRGGVSLAVE